MKVRRCTAVFLLRRILRTLERIARGLEALNTSIRVATDQPDPMLTMDLGEGEASVTVMTDRESRENEEEDRRNARLR